ncbi:Yip1 domain-containing protein [Toxoplasma gondii]|uniref:Yip1 domain-containing protein n=1 Tax=Toxoplasma gondii TaxID=5811 RepID=Q1JT28_TOXGO|nr:Yip1 domain-containing protein [Toxoplasma gondii]CAJ20446.1 hypothetical protein TgIa.1940c [Toxoplasma gondii RH]
MASLDTADLVASQAPLPPDWYEYHDPRGVPYFHHPRLNVTQWERPTASASPTVSLEPQRSLESASSRPTVDLSAGRGALGSDRKAGSLQGDFLSLSDASLEPHRSLRAEAKARGALLDAPEPARFSDEPRRGGFFGLCGCCDEAAGHLYRLFDVTTEQILQRLRLSLLPWKTATCAPSAASACAGDVPEAADQGPSSASASPLGALSTPASLVFLQSPDAYGPFWCATTLVLLCFACSNLPLLLWPTVFAAAGLSADVGLLTQAAGAVYAALFVPPLLVWLGLLWEKHSGAGVQTPEAPASQEPRFDQLLCLQGYALVPLCAGTACLLVLGLLPHHPSVAALRWAAVGAAGAAASRFLYVHLTPLLSGQRRGARLAAIAGLLASVLLLLFVLLSFARTSQLPDTSPPAAVSAEKSWPEQNGDSPEPASGPSRDRYEGKQGAEEGKEEGKEGEDGDRERDRGQVVRVEGLEEKFVGTKHEHVEEAGRGTEGEMQDERRGDRPQARKREATEGMEETESLSETRQTLRREDERGDRDHGETSGAGEEGVKSGRERREASVGDVEEENAQLEETRRERTDTKESDRSEASP